MEMSLPRLLLQLFESRDPGTAQRWREIFMAHRPDVCNMTYLQQVQAVNNFWRTQLGSLPVNTIAERECLVSDATVVDWLRMFEMDVLPTIIEYQLPRLRSR